MLVTRRVEHPVRIDIEDGTTTITPVEGLWGADTVETCRGTSPTH
jgi:aldehyde:ferredoxin oxidoreductase